MYAKTNLLPIGNISRNTRDDWILSLLFIAILEDWRFLPQLCVEHELENKDSWSMSFPHGFVLDIKEIIARVG